MKILSLTEENYKKISFVELMLDGKGGLVIVAGRNEQGKSSLLDGIEALLNGADSIPNKPVRRGQEKSTLHGEIGLPGNVEFTVKRVITAAGGGSLVVRNKDGEKQNSPQAILDALKSKLTFDPLAFSKMKKEEMGKTIRALLGLDFTAQDAEKQRVFDQRTDVNRDVRSLESRITVLPPVVPGLPELEISSAEIIAQQTEAAKTNTANTTHRTNAEGCKQAWERACASVEDTVASIKSVEEEIEKLRNTLTENKATLDKRVAECNAAKASHENAANAVSKLVDIDLAQFNARAADVDKTNASIRANKSRADLSTQLSAKRKAADELTRQIDRIEAAKRERVATTKFPVTGMGLDDMGEVLLDGIPFEQASTKGKIVASMAMGAALNPKLRVILVRSGNDLDDDAMKLVADWAATNDMQVWLERIRTDGDVSVIIEDGHVAGVEPPVVKESEEKHEPVKTDSLNQSVQTDEKVNRPVAEASAPVKRGPKRPPAPQSKDDLIP